MARLDSLLDSYLFAKEIVENKIKTRKEKRKEGKNEN